MESTKFVKWRLWINYQAYSKLESIELNETWNQSKSCCTLDQTMFLHNTKVHEAMPTEFVAIKAIEKQKQEIQCNQNEIDLKTNRYRNKKGFKIKKLKEISLKIYYNSPPCCLLRLNCSRDANFPAFFPFLVKTRRHRSADWRELGKYIFFLPFTIVVLLFCSQ